jgi:hypothetical protein
MRIFWLFALMAALGIALGTDCGAITLEPLPPEEPLPEAAPPPRLARPDAGPGPNAPNAPESEEP